jgi:hypothetical protein
MAETPYCEKHQRYLRNGDCIDCVSAIESARLEGRMSAMAERHPPDPRDEQIRALREALSHIEDETVERIAAFAVGWDMPGFINGLRRGDWRKT